MKRFSGTDKPTGCFVYSMFNGVKIKPGESFSETFTRTFDKGRTSAEAVIYPHVSTLIKIEYGNLGPADPFRFTVYNK